MSRRSLTGAWIETFFWRSLEGARGVAPLRGRGLKLNSPKLAVKSVSRSLTGAWIETSASPSTVPPAAVAPLRGRGLKHQREYEAGGPVGSLPYGGVD